MNENAMVNIIIKYSADNGQLKGLIDALILQSNNDGNVVTFRTTIFNLFVDAFNQLDRKA